MVEESAREVFPFSAALVGGYALGRLPLLLPLLLLVPAETVSPGALLGGALGIFLGARAEIPRERRRQRPP